MRPIDVLVVGASARGAAAAAVRAGFRPALADLFGDLDARELGPSLVLPRAEYPQGFAAAAPAWSGVPRMYVGGLENHPEAVAALAADGPLWGETPATLRRVRAPEFLVAAADAAGPPLVPPAFRRETAGVPTDGTWLCKRSASSAGRGISEWRGGALPPDAVLQPRLPGPSIAAVFCGADFLGATRQLVGEPWLHAPEFAYCGSLGPLPVSPDLAAGLARFAGAAALRGAWGLDLVAGPEGWTPVDLNPRWTASMELFDRWSAEPLFARHAAAFGGRAARPPAAGTPAGEWHGKAIVHAPHAGTVGDLRADFPTGELADIPHPGTAFAAGTPVCTVFADGGSEPACRDRLQAAARRVFEAFRSARRAR